MKDKVMQLRVTDDFVQMVEHLQRINNYKSASDTIRKTVEKEYRKEAKQGRWDFEGWNTFTCTNCGAVYGKEQLEDLRQYESDPAFPRYCPHCGARMDGEA